MGFSSLPFCLTLLPRLFSNLNLKKKKKKNGLILVNSRLSVTLRKARISVLPIALLIRCRFVFTRNGVAGVDYVVHKLLYMYLNSILI